LPAFTDEGTSELEILSVRAELLTNNLINNHNSNINFIEQQPTAELNISNAYSFGQEQQHLEPQQFNGEINEQLTNSFINQKNCKSNNLKTVLNDHRQNTHLELNQEDFFDLLATTSASSKENHQQQQMFKTNAIMHINASEKFLNSSKLNQDYR
jgi:hypothetical protein